MHHSSSVDGGYAWMIVLAVFWNNAHHWGVLSSYGIFLEDFISNSRISGGTSLDFALIGGLSASQALVISPLVTMIHRRFGLKTTMALGVLLETAALLGASWSTKVWQLYLSQGVCFGWGLGLQYLSTTFIIPQWFSKKRSLAAGITTAGTGTGGLIYSLATHSMLAWFGSSWSYRILAIIQFVVNTICVLLLRDRVETPPTQKGKRSVRLSLGKRYETWVFIGWSFFSVMGFMVIWYSLATYSRSIGLSASQGSIVTAVMNVGQIFGRPAVGYFSDIVGRFNMTAFATFTSGLLCLLLWVFATTYAALICFALFAGILFGTFWTAVGPLGAEVVGLDDLQSFLTMMWLVCSVPATFAEAIGLKLRTSGDQEFLHTQLFTGFMYIGATLCIVLLRGWKISQRKSLEPGEYRRISSGLSRVVAWETV
ncbi:major facilitator superfamily domain-containing protein [Aspergillus bertholletiae]|uniref:Major facilitator superfamily domain-containing protein n=1 Tax=Aspergillus bertholletiae TaxID=1226010 RepID=A0A5N7AR94_9EURO|nr:major facilitator superfamily domain-containing protein [Aspergillus bertholletiae]